MLISARFFLKTAMLSTLGFWIGSNRLAWRLHLTPRLLVLRRSVIQIFVKNPRGWARKAWSDKEREQFARLFHDLPVVAHLSYLPNIARADEEPQNREGILHEAAL